jgi:integrase
MPALDAAGLPRRRIYDLRHTAISHWLAAGLGSFEVARFMGTSVRMVDLTYGHLVSGSELDARRRLDEWATGPRGTRRVTSCKPLNHEALRGWAILGSNQ